MTNTTINLEEKISFSASDDWDLIRIIATSLSSRDTKVQVKELVDNALDAFSRVKWTPLEGKQVKVIIRKKDKHDPNIKIFDNGPGWEPHKDPTDKLLGMPDFEYTVKHIGDSIKKKYSEFRKASEEGRSVGQFAIGLFSFWGLGSRLTIYSRSYLGDSNIGPCSKMVWIKDAKDATIAHNIEPPTELSRKAGSLVIIDQLQKSQMNSITGNILCTYLSRACRTVLMKNPDVDVVIDDHGSKTTVKPKKYEGNKFKVTRTETEGGFGFIDMEIYANPPVESPEEFQVPIFQKGAKVYNDITEIPELNIYPWNSKKVYGEINYPFGTLSPSRTAFVNDEWLGAFIKAMLKTTKELAQLVDRIEALKRAKQRNKFNQIFKDTWRQIFKNLPEDWNRKGFSGSPLPTKTPVSVEIGPLYRVEISPDSPKIAFHNVESFTARPFDLNGNILKDSSLIYYWKFIGKPLGKLTDDMKRTCHFQASNLEGITALTVTVLQFLKEGNQEKTMKKNATINFWVVKELPPRPPSSPPSGDQPPNYETEHAGEDADRSRYKPETKIVFINEDHKDYLNADKTDEMTLDRYVNYCFSKEIAVDRWKNSDPHELSERIIELVALSERTFDWKEIAKKPKGRHPKGEPNSIITGY